VALLLVLVGVAIASPFLWAHYHLRAARQAIERYHFEEAQDHLDQCLKVRSGSAAVHLLAAQTARRRDAYDDAERHLTAAVQLGGTTKETMLERLLLSAQQGDFKGSETSLRARAAQDDPDSIPVLEALAKGYISRFWYSQALVSLTILLDRQPDHPQALVMRARLWEDRVRKGEKERDTDALRDYRKALALQPTYEARVGFARTLYRIGQPWDALCQFKALYQANPTDPEVLLGLARCFFVTSDTSLARRFLDELLALKPEHAAGLLERARLALYAGQLAEAEELLRRSAAAAPRYDCEAQRLLCQCLEAEHKAEDARRCLSLLAEREEAVLAVDRQTMEANRDPNNIALRYKIATQLIALGREEDGVGTLLFVLEQDPGHSLARQAVLNYFERTGQSKRATRLRLTNYSATGAAPPQR
jgi:thioredoxin-like negative regulator of GroEL